MAGSYERTSSLWKVSKQIHGVKRSSGISLHCLILCALFCHYCWTFKCRPMPSFFGPIDNVERAIGKIPHLLIKTCAKWTRYLRLLATNPRCVCVCVCVCVCWEMQVERVVLTVFSAIFPSNNVLVPLAPNSVFLKLTWGNPPTISFLLVQIYWLCKHGLTFLIALSNLFSNFQRFSKVSCLYMVLCTIFSAHRNFVYLLIWGFFPLLFLDFNILVEFW